MEGLGAYWLAWEAGAVSAKHAPSVSPPGPSTARVSVNDHRTCTRNSCGRTGHCTHTLVTVVFKPVDITSEPKSVPGVVFQSTLKSNTSHCAPAGVRTGHPMLCACVSDTEA
eukprot:832722-Rhodomonas_salina.2